MFTKPSNEYFEKKCIQANESIDKSSKTKIQKLPYNIHDLFIVNWNSQALWNNHRKFDPV